MKKYLRLILSLLLLFIVLLCILCVVEFWSDPVSSALTPIEDGSHIVSEFGTEEQYVCEGSCWCETDRRTYSVKYPKKGLAVLVASLTSIVAYQKANDHLAEDCKDLLSESCPLSSTYSEVDNCRRMSEDNLAKFEKFGHTISDGQNSFKSLFGTAHFYSNVNTGGNEEYICDGNCWCEGDDSSNFKKGISAEVSSPTSFMADDYVANYFSKSCHKKLSETCPNESIFSKVDNCRKKQNNDYDVELELIHNLCKNNQQSVPESRKCGCFHCLSVYEADTVTEFVNGGRLALCPQCGIDSVICEAWLADNMHRDAVTGEVSTDLLERMKEYWFDRNVHVLWIPRN